ncbi:Histidine transport system permease protein HisQ [compost metagenome]
MLIKATALVSIIGLIDIVKVTQDAGKHSMQLFYFSLIGALIYLAITTLSNGILMWLERRYSAGVRGAQL